jgi:hypothetical protein
MAAAALVQGSTPGLAEEESPPGPYIDRLIPPERLPSLVDDPVDHYDDTGLPRTYSLETTWGFTQFDGARQEEYGAAGSAFWGTDLWGGFSLDAGAYKSALSGETTIFGSFWQRGLNLPGGWQGSHGLGVLNVVTPDLQRSQARFFMPGNPLLGVVSQWRHEHGLKLHASAGTPGVFSSGRLSGFETGDGHTVAVGGDWSPAPGWQAAASLISTQGRESRDLDPGTGQADGDGVFAGAAWTGPVSRVQFNVLAAQNHASAANLTAGERSPLGGWVDASTLAGWYEHSYGLFSLDRGLNWGGEPMTNNAKGGYYRVRHQRMRWTWSAAIDHLQPSAGPGSNSTFASGTMRYQASSRLGLGGSTTVRSSAADAWTAQLFADHRNRFGITRTQLDLADDDSGNSGIRAALTQSFPSAIGIRLSATASHGETTRAASGKTRTSTLAAFGSRDLLARLSLDGSASFHTESGADAQNGFSANLGLNWQLNRSWRLLAIYTRSTTRRENVFVLDPFPDPNELQRSLDAESFFITLRYTHRAGRPGGVLGGGPGTPAGFIQGMVFLDENEDGLRDGTEAGVANITIVLDERFTVRTDSQGNFAFPMVATGTYTLRVLPDNLPLPWNFEDGVGERTVEVTVRQQTQLVIPAQRAR